MTLQRLIGMLALVLLAQVAWAATPQLQLTDLDGREHSLADYRGKWVVVNYWATWCPPCREELPELEVFYTSNRDQAVVLGINMEDIDDAQLRRFVEEQFLSFPILRGTRAAAKAFGPIPGLPTTYLVAPDGEVVARQVGAVTAAGIERFITGYRPQTGQ